MRAIVGDYSRPLQEFAPAILDEGHCRRLLPAIAGVCSCNTLWIMFPALVLKWFDLYSEVVPFAN